MMAVDVPHFVGTIVLGEGLCVCAAIPTDLKQRPFFICFILISPATVLSGNTSRKWDAPAREPAA